MGGGGLLKSREKTEKNTNMFDVIPVKNSNPLPYFGSVFSSVFFCPFTPGWGWGINISKHDDIYDSFLSGMLYPGFGGTKHLHLALELTVRMIALLGSCVFLCVSRFVFFIKLAFFFNRNSFFF